MPNIEGFHVEFAEPQIYRPRLRGNTPSRTIDNIADALMDAGWSLVGQTTPQAELFLYMVLSFEPPDPLPEVLDPRGCHYEYASIGGNHLVGYNPYTQTPPIACCSFPWGGNEDSSVANIIEAIEDCYPYTVEEEIRGGRRFLILTGTIPGTVLNGYETEGNYTGHLTNFTRGSWGGGYVLRSQTHHAQWIQMTITDLGPTGSFPGQISCDFTCASGGDVNFRITPEGYEFSIVANKYQFALWTPDVDGDTGGSSGSTSLFACVPKMDDPTVGDAAFVVGGNGGPSDGTYAGSLRSSLTYNYCAVALNGPLIRVSEGVSIYSPRLRGGVHALRTSKYEPLRTNPWVGLTQTTRDEMRVVGRIWDGYVETDCYGFGSQTASRTKKYIQVSRQDGSWRRARASLWLSTGDLTE